MTQPFSFPSAVAVFVPQYRPPWITAEELAMIGNDEEKGYKYPGQPRDDHGRFGSGGSHSSSGDSVLGHGRVTPEILEAVGNAIGAARTRRNSDSIIKSIDTLNHRMHLHDKELEGIRKSVLRSAAIRETKAKRAYDALRETEKKADEIQKHYESLPESDDGYRDAKIKYLEETLRPACQELKQAQKAWIKTESGAAKAAHELIEKKLNDPDGTSAPTIRARPDGIHSVMDTIDPKVADRVAQTKNFLEGVVSSGYAHSMNKVRVDQIPMEEEQRSYHKDGSYGPDADGFTGSKIWMAAHAGADTYAHEFGHALETNYEAGQMARAFFYKRTEGKGLVRLQEKYPNSNYKAEEIGSEDDFRKTFGDHAEYVGKFYPHGATEIMAMGMEKLYRHPVEFARSDPEYFKLVVGIASGRLLSGELPP